jgi:phosphonate transport system substrate-binding protein
LVHTTSQGVSSFVPTKKGKQMIRRYRARPLALTVAAMLAMTAACGESLDSGAEGSSGQEGNERWPETIEYGLLPTGDQDELVALYTPFEEYMTGCLDHPFELFTGTDYNVMIEAMRAGNIHVSRFGPFSYIIAHDRSDAEALTIAVSDASTPTYTSLITTRKSLGFTSIGDLEGRSFAFVDPTSSSGHLYPRARIIDEAGITNDEVENWLGDVVYAGNHPSALLSVLNGDTDAGALASNSSNVVNENGVWKIAPDSEFADHPAADDFMVLAESVPIPRTVEAVKADLPDSLKQALTDCFLAVADEPSLAEFREEGGIAEGYIPADDSDYDPVRTVASALGMAPEELLEQ